MRISLGATLAYLADGTPAMQNIIGAAAGVFVLAGLWTPVAATVAALDQMWIAWAPAPSQQGDEWIHILLGVLCASVAMLGPGAWSIDARLFGRRRFPTHQATRKGPPSKG